MKKWFRWWGIAVFFGLIILLSAGWLLLADRIVKTTLEAAATRVVGAKVDIGKADMSLLPTGLTLSGLQVTNPQRPMRNALQAERIALNLDAAMLLRRKVHIGEMTIDGVRLNTPRKRSGAVGNGAGRRQHAADKKDPSSGAESDQPGGLLADRFEVPDAKAILKKEKLQTLELAESLQSDIQKEKRRWELRLDELPDKEKLASYRARIDKLKNARKGGLGALLGASTELVTLQKDLERDIDRIESALNEFETQSRSLEKQMTQLAKAPEADLRRLKNKYSLPAKGLSNIGGLFLKQRLQVWLERAIAWYERLQPLLARPAATSEGPRETTPLRGKGVNIRFAEAAPQPDLLIHRTRVGIELKQIQMTGDIETITSDPPLVGRPLRFDFAGKGDTAGAVRLSGELDATDPSRRQGKADFQMQDVAVGPRDLVNQPGLVARLQSAVVDLDVRAALAEERIDVKLDTGIDAVRLATETNAGQSALTQALGGALANVRRMKATATVKGTLQQQQIQLSTDLDRVFANAMAGLARQQTAKLTQSLRREINAETSPQITATDSQLKGFGRIGDELSGRLNLGENLLKGLL